MAKKKHLHNRVNKEELRQKVSESPIERTTLSFYKYVTIQDPLSFRNTFYDQLTDLEVLGRIYIANEGVNGQISIPTNQVNALKKLMDATGYFEKIRLNLAIEDDGKSFFKLTIKVKDRIVADGLAPGEFDLQIKGHHIDAQKFNELASKDDTVIVDMRNHYESEVGHFENAIRPDVETFRESLPIVNDILQEHKEKNILMYCTGGIRCEKASAYFKNKGFDKVYQLDGGIIEYARQVDKNGLENKFIGKNFVFDERMGERISEDVIAKCHQCGDECDTHVNCENHRCHILFIQCEKCAQKYNQCCSRKCADFNKLTEAQRAHFKEEPTFNGTNAGKARFNSLDLDAPLNMKAIE